MFNSVKFFAFFIILCGISSGQRSQVEEELVRSLSCVLHEACGPCLAAAAHCRWCSDPYFHADSAAAPRCDLETSLVNAGCSQFYIESPQQPRLEVKQDDPLTDRTPDQLKRAVQIQPQRIAFTLRPHESRKFIFTYRPARNYPLDLYYLMDLTWSMKDDKEMLVSLRDDLPVMLKNLTDNFRLGFGSFAEKPVLPFIFTDDTRRSNPCAGESDVCQPTYSFRHHLSLTDQVDQFIERVNKSSVTANVDQAEAGLDALLQALVCQRELAWSDVSRKIIIFLSDGYLHFAGDGKLGGAMQRNDEQCHLDENGFYTNATTFDYPSIAQIHRLLAEKKVNIIFGVIGGVKQHYDELHKLLEDNTYVGLLEEDSSNILKLVKKGYEDIISVVHFDDDSSGPVDLVYYSDCGGQTSKKVKTKKCTGVEFGKSYNFEVEIKMDACPEYKAGQKQIITIKDTQLGQDSLTLEIELLCGCSCEEKDKEFTTLCHENSEMTCGICQCIGGRAGPKCDCDTSNYDTSVALNANCREPNTTRGVLCSGAGDCLCGQCYCDQGRYGKYCECKPCPINADNGLECGGPERGVCGCGSCACAADWTGDSCSCSTRQDSCLAPGDTSPCSGHGDCVCGKCQCSVEDGVRYAGVFCETCATCDNAICSRCEACVACTLLNNCTTECTDARDVSCNVTLDINNSSDASTAEDWRQAWCVTRAERDGMECEYGYTYRSLGPRAVGLTVRSERCAQFRSAMIMTSGLIIMAFTVAVGILMIAFVKSFQVVADRRAYAQFRKEAEHSMLAMSNQNPLYISPISEFKPPESFPREDVY